MQVNQEIIAWVGSEHAALVADTRLAEFASIRLVEDEAGAWSCFPPRGNPRLYLLDVSLLADASPAFVAALASRPSNWPPIVVIGRDHSSLAACPVKPNSRILIGGEDGLDKLLLAARYWGQINEPLKLD